MAVSQGMWGGVFVNTSLFKGFAEDLLDAGCAVLPASLTFEKPLFGFVQLIVISQKFYQFLGKQGVSVFSTFGVDDLDKHSFGIYIRDPKIY